MITNNKPRAIYNYVDAYQHNNRIAAIIKIQCEDDLTFHTMEFKDFVKCIFQQIIAHGPNDNTKPGSEIKLLTEKYLKNEDITVLEYIREVERSLGVCLKILEFKRIEI